MTTLNPQPRRKNRRAGRKKHGTNQYSEQSAQNEHSAPEPSEKTGASKAKPETARKLAKVLKVKPEDLF